ncbi:hypothetical protein [Giesbergeria giesbergeri]
MQQQHRGISPNNPLTFVVSISPTPVLIPKLSKFGFVFTQKAALVFGVCASCSCFRIGTGVGSFFQLCCWLWVTAVWA